MRPPEEVQQFFLGVDKKSHVVCGVFIFIVKKSGYSELRIED